MRELQSKVTRSAERVTPAFRTLGLLQMIKRLWAILQTGFLLCGQEGVGLDKKAHDFGQLYNADATISPEELLPSA